MEIVAKLIAKTDAKTEIIREVFATQSSVGRQEFFECGKNNMKPSFKLEILNSEYQGEEIVEVDDKRYSVYRSYYNEKEDIMELYCHEKGGIFGNRN